MSPTPQLKLTRIVPRSLSIQPRGDFTGPCGTICGQLLINRGRPLSSPRLYPLASTAWCNQNRPVQPNRSFRFLKVKLRAFGKAGFRATSSGGLSKWWCADELHGQPPLSGVILKVIDNARRHRHEERQARTLRTRGEDQRVSPRRGMAWSPDRTTQFESPEAARRRFRPAWALPCAKSARASTSSSVSAQIRGRRR